MRWLGLDGNPMRRAVDRIEAAVKVALLTAFLAAGPPLAAHIAHHVEIAGLHAQHRQAPRHTVLATLLANTPPPPGHASTETDRPLVKALWMAPDGAPRTGDIRASWEQQAGSTVTIWIDHTGRLTDPPLRHSQIVTQGRIAATLALAASALAALIIHGLVRHVLDRRRMTGWETSWSAVEPQWTGRRHHH
jgi:hypothetical protein